MKLQKWLQRHVTSKEDIIKNLTIAFELELKD